MNDRKQHVIKMAHQLFTDKGFQNTSIQDILDYSGISKGTFYNYFSSKNELLITLIKTIYKQLEQDRNELLIGQDPSDIDVFIKQIELHLNTNRANKLISLFEEVLILNDADLKQFIKQGQMRILHWLFLRFIDIFGENKRPCLLDCAIMFMGILHQNLKYQAIVPESNASINQIVRYSVERIMKMVEEVSQSGDQLIPPELLDHWLPDSKNPGPAFQQQLYHTVLTLKKQIKNNNEESKYLDLLDFVQEELLNSKEPRKFLVESALLSLKGCEPSFEQEILQNLERLVAVFFSQIEETS
ncbi:TetR/AcrR family transcriptional regulator [Peribacillus glennii]|uniref:TetR/AcrR family transcriptional regulator n=1 Tax=Peribacillus glennii TaxID=2303991 RepID=A0A372L8M4_9BACI|nr:TetR/AcrR family transcriptional regulator [Peribacillus glennii]RFU61764.1 TetR/AcrR family transcriptional regulator [Peribacillus glennii]